MQQMIKKAAALSGIFVGAWAVMAGAVTFIWYAVKVAGKVVGWLP